MLRDAVRGRQRGQRIGPPLCAAPRPGSTRPSAVPLAQDLAVVLTVSGGIVGRLAGERSLGADWAAGATSDCESPPSLLACSLKLECDKLATEKSEMQRHYIMVGVRLLLRRDLRASFLPLLLLLRQPASSLISLSPVVFMQLPDTAPLIDPSAGLISLNLSHVALKSIRPPPPSQARAAAAPNCLSGLHSAGSEMGGGRFWRL